MDLDFSKPSDIELIKSEEFIGWLESGLTRALLRREPWAVCWWNEAKKEIVNRSQIIDGRLVYCFDDDTAEIIPFRKRD